MRDITLCHPRLQTLATELIKECAKQGLQIKIGEPLRTTAEPTAAVPIMIKMDSFPKSGRSEWHLVSNGVEIGNPSWTNLTSSFQTGVAVPVG